MLIIQRMVITSPSEQGKNGLWVGYFVLIGLSKVLRLTIRNTLDMHNL